MSIYRTSMMLCSSMFALSLMITSEGFCDGEQKAASTAKASESKEKERVKPAEGVKPSEKKAVDSKKESKAKAKVKVDIAAPLSDAEEDELEKRQRKEIEQAQRKSKFAAKIKSVQLKYATLLGSISGEPKEVITEKLNSHSAKVRRVLSESLTNSKSETETSTDAKPDVFKKLENGIKRKNAFVQSKKESVGVEDAAWFEEVNVAAQKQLKRLEKLKDEFEKNKGDAAKQEETRVLYDKRIASFIASYDAFTACTHYLASAKTFCNDAAISSSNMKVQFPDFSAKAFKEFAVPDDLLNGERAPLARVNGYSFYAIDKKEYKKGEFSKEISSDSEDGKLIAAAKSLSTEDSKKILDPDNGGLILSSRMILKPGMSRPLCVFSAYALNGETEIISRFSVVHGTEENMRAERQLTAQLIKAENKPTYDALAAANEKLKKALSEQIKEADGKSAKKAESPKKEKDKEKSKEKSKESKDRDEGKKKPTRSTQDKPESKDAVKADDKPTKVKDSDKEGSAEVKADSKPKSKGKKKVEDAKATDADVKPKSKEVTVEAPADDKPADEKSKVKAKKKADDAKATETDDKPKVTKAEAESTDTKAVKDTVEKPKEAVEKSKEVTEKPKEKEAPVKKEKAAPALETVTKEEANSGGFFSRLFSGPSKETDKPQTN